MSILVIFLCLSLGYVRLLVVLGYLAQKGHKHTIRTKNCYEGHPESKERLRIESAHLFCCSWSLVSGVQCEVENCLKQLYVVPWHVVSAEIAEVVAVPIENPANCEVRGVIRFQQVDEILGYPAEEASSRVELFCCTTMHVRIMPGRHKPRCVSNFIVTSSSILRTVRTWHRRPFSWLACW